MAYDAASDGLRAFPDHVRLQQLLALALARAGASEPANTRLRELRDAGHADEETLGMLARTHKDLWASAADAGERRRHLEQAHRVYLEAFQRSGGYWSGINVATTALLLGRRDDAVAAARQVRDTCIVLHQADPQRPDRYWLLATLGEAALVMGDHPAAQGWYQQAVGHGAGRLGDLVSTRRNARLILRHLGLDTAPVDACFAIPRVVVFAGHLVDRPGRPQPRFPPGLEPAVQRAIGDRLSRLGPAIGFASAACGADILFLEALAELGSTSRIVLPYNRDEFVRNSVDIVPGGDWSARFDRVIGRAAEVTVASEHPIGSGSTSYEYAFRLLDGSAGIRADELDTELRCLAVWDGSPGDGAGGTATAIAHWKRHGRAVDVIDLTRLRQDAGPAIASAPRPAGPASAGATPRPARRRFEPRIVGLLFADAPGFSRLGDLDLPLFVDKYLGLVASEMKGLGSPPLLVNTWGDGLYVVFGRVRDAGVFALRLCDTIARTDWRGLGFSSDMSVRIGLHAGPAYACLDPVTERPNYIGAHVSRAARIEPITPPGAVFASSAFAALARADGVDEFACTYVGPTPLAKGYGTFPTFLVRARQARGDTPCDT